MGDRGNVVLKIDGNTDLVFYTHWDGSKLPKTIQKALKRGKERWNQHGYLNRIIFSEMIKGHLNELTGFGIYTGDPPEIPCITINHTLETVEWWDDCYTFDEFVEMDM